MGSVSVGSSERSSEYSDNYANNQSPQPFFPPPPPPRRDSNVSLPPRAAPPHTNQQADNSQVFVFDDRISQLPMSPPEMRGGALESTIIDGLRNLRTPTNGIPQAVSKSNDHTDSNRKDNRISEELAGIVVDDETMYADSDEVMYADQTNRNVTDTNLVPPPPPLPTKVAPLPPTRTFSKSSKIGR